MKKFFKKKGLIIIAAALIVVVISVVSGTVSKGDADLATDADSVIMKPMRTVTASMIDSLEQLYNYIYRYDQMEAENQELRAQLAQMEREYREYGEISEENDRLRSLLEFSQRNESYKYDTAAIISWSASNWSSSFTINKGSASGLELHDTVIDESGYLVGQITELSASTATVTTILDTSSSIGAQISSTNDSTVAQGDFELMKEGNLKISFLEEGQKLITGDSIITSGKGGIFPQGLEIGKIAGAEHSATGLENYAVIEPSADLERITNVFIITSFEMTE